VRVNTAIPRLNMSIILITIFIVHNCPITCNLLLTHFESARFSYCMFETCSRTNYRFAMVNFHYDFLSIVVARLARLLSTACFENNYCIRMISFKSIHSLFLRSLLVPSIANHLRCYYIYRSYAMIYVHVVCIGWKCLVARTYRRNVRYTEKINKTDFPFLCPAH
jgi:hypothetical protein